MKPLLSTLLLLISFLGKAQNLVMNPSFEEYYNCPLSTGDFEKCKSVVNPVCADSQLGSCNSTPDYFNACADYNSNVNVPYTYAGSQFGYSYRNAKDGNAFIGIANALLYNPVTHAFSYSIREFAQIKLTDPLIAGKQYDFSFYVGTSTPRKKYNIEINQLGIHFVNDSIIYPNMKLWQFMNADWVCNEYISDSTGWQKLSGSYIASGGEKWLIIGVFNSQEEFPHKISITLIKIK